MKKLLATFGLVTLLAITSTPGKTLADDDVAKALADEANWRALAYLVDHPEKMCEHGMWKCTPGWRERLAACQATKNWIDQRSEQSLTAMDVICSSWRTGETFGPPAPAPAAPDAGT
jgi:hypothetical protein